MGDHDSYSDMFNVVPLARFKASRSRFKVGTWGR
jgi:hypothetical protein